MNRPNDVENGMILYRDKEESDYSLDDYLADEEDRLRKEKQIEENENA